MQVLTVPQSALMPGDVTPDYIIDAVWSEYIKGMTRHCALLRWIEPRKAWVPQKWPDYVTGLRTDLADRTPWTVLRAEA